MLITLSFLFISSAASAQNNRKSGEERTEIKKTYRVDNFKYLGTLLEAKKFVFLAEINETPIGDFKLRGVYAIIINDSVITKIRYSKSQITYYEGFLEDWQMKANSKNLTYMVEFNFITPNRFSDQNISITIDSYCDAFYRANSIIMIDPLTYPAFYRGTIISPDSLSKMKFLQINR